jgi:hypothetical protein
MGVVRWGVKRLGASHFPMEVSRQTGVDEAGARGVVEGQYTLYRPVSEPNCQEGRTACGIVYDPHVAHPL